MSQLIDIGSITFVWRGRWNGNTEDYMKNNVVKHKNDVYIALGDDVAKGAIPGQSDEWELFLSGNVTRVAYEIGEFKSWFKQMPPEGWEVRDGRVLENACEAYPELWDALMGEEAWRCVSEDEWQALSREEPWNGIGGVTWFVLDEQANTIRLPDTRGMYAEDAGFDGLEVGGVHGDAIRNITGKLGRPVISSSQSSFVPFNEAEDLTGAFAAKSYSGIYTLGSDIRGYMWTVDMDASRTGPIANKNQPRAFGLLPCVYVGVRK